MGLSPVVNAWVALDKHRGLFTIAANASSPAVPVTTPGMVIKLSAVHAMATAAVFEAEANLPPP